MTRIQSKVEIDVTSCCSPLSTSSLSNKEATELANTFAALSDPIRLRLFSFIASATNNEVCACEFVSALKRSQPTISHHLKVLREAGLVQVERRGQWLWYSVNQDQLSQLRLALK